jgi:hypothetical protein
MKSFLALLLLLVAFAVSAFDPPDRSDTVQFEQAQTADLPDVYTMPAMLATGHPQPLRPSPCLVLYSFDLNNTIEATNVNSSKWPTSYSKASEPARPVA